MSVGRRYVVVFLCFVGLLISIGSREVFTIVVTHVIQSSATTRAPQENEFHLKCIPANDSTRNLQKNWPRTYVFLFQTVYFIGYILTQLPGGILAVKFSPRRVFGLCIMISSVLNILMRFVIQYHYWLVFLLRLIQGLVEGPAIPAMNGMLSKWTLKSEKSKMVTIAYSGAYLSAAVAGVSTGLLICKVSWGSALFIYGGTGLLWAALWLWFVDDSPASCRGMSDSEREMFHQENKHAHRGHKSRAVPWKKILTSLPMSAIFVAAFCRNWIFALLLTQIPQYYKDVFTMHASEYGTWSSLPHVFMTCVVISGGLFVDKMIKKKYISTTIARKAAETVGFGVEAGCIMALGFTDNKTLSIVLLCVGVSVSGLAISGYQTNPLDLAPQYASVLTGVVRLGTIGSVLSTVIAVEFPAKKHTTESWQIVFIISASLHLFGVVYYLIFASGERQPWAAIDDLERSAIYSQSNTYGATGNDIPRDEMTGNANGLIVNGYQHGLLSGQSDMDIESIEAAVCDSQSDDDVDDDEESLFTKSMHVEGLSYSEEENDDFDTPGWFLATI